MTQHEIACRSPESSADLTPKDRSGRLPPGHRTPTSWSRLQPSFRDCAAEQKHRKLGGRGSAAISPIIALILLTVLTGCGSAWQATVVAPDGSDYVVDSEVLRALDSFAEEDGDVPLERVLYCAGHRAIQGVTVVDGDGRQHEIDWADAAEEPVWRKDGKIALGGKVLPVVRVEILPPELLAQVSAGIIDIVPTAAAALGLPAPALACGQVLDASPADQVLLLFLDGFGYARYTEALDDGLIPNLAALGEPRVALTVYPPSTSVASAALLTGAPPEVNGVDRRGIRMTDEETLFDVAAAAGLDVVAVEGNALAFNLRNSQMHLSGDRDGNGRTDDNVLANALVVLEEGMPDLLYVHFHGIDDTGHTYGPGAPEEAATIREVDAAVGYLFESLPSGTLAIVFADHGMHAVQEDGRLGNHEHLIERDMFIPFWMVRK